MWRESEFESLLKKMIRSHNWPDIADRWLQDIPVIEPAGAMPDASLEDVVGFSNLPHIFPPAEAVGETPRATAYSEVPGLRKALLRESVFLLHKAAHVVSAAELSAARGQLTWSLSDGYHGALFGARAIIGLLGVGSLNTGTKVTTLFNIWPVRPEHEHKRKSPKFEHPREILFAQLSFKIEHRHIWTIFTRLLRTFNVPSWPKDIINKIKNLDGKSFSRQRNAIHYGNHSWPNDDLHERIQRSDFGMRSLARNSNPEEEDPDFSLALALLVLRLGRILLNGFSTGLLNEERHLFDEKMSRGWHPLSSAIFPATPDGSGAPNP